MNHKCNPERIKYLKELTLKIQHSCFDADNVCLKWSLLNEYKTNFLDGRHYCQPVVTSYIGIISTLVDSLKPEIFLEKNDHCLFDDIFLLGVQHESFLLLINRLKTNDSFVEQKIVKLLQMFLQNSSFETLLMYQCQNHIGWDLKYVSQSSIWNTLITAIISLPERIANKTRGNFIKIFSPGCYFPLIISSVFKVLSFIHNCLENSEDSSVEFLAKLIGRLCIIGHADIVATKFSKEFVKVIEKDFIWRRISQNFIQKIPSNSLDSFLTNLLLKIPWYGYVEWILGEEGVTNEKINYIMTVKIPFVRVYKKDLILQNAIGYFASSHKRLPQFWKILNSLLDSWMDKRSLLCQNAEHKMKVASTLIMCAGWLSKFKSEIDTNAYISKILQGTQIRLESSEGVVRSQGMIVGEQLIKAIDPDSPALEFEFKDSPMLNHLRSLLKIPEKPSHSSINFEDLKCFQEAEKERFKEDSSSTLLQTSTAVDELDSDDELEPYDLSSDTATRSIKRPLYLRDCLKGLIEQEAADYTAQCLEHAEELIKKNPFATQEVSEEMSKIVLHMDDKFAIPNFIALRHKILITLTVECPIVVSNFLISQFSARDYNIRQRLDILEVLAASSIALSHPKHSLKGQPHVTEKLLTSEEDCWKLVVQQRLKAKTKCYTKAQKPILTENNFSAVAGHFFFPLLSCYVKRDSFFDVREETYVLGRFIQTLGMIMYAATNTANCRHVGTTFLQFLATVRSHSDVSIRQAVLFGIATTYMSVPCSVLLSEMLPEVLDTNEWLQSIVQSDPESSCVEKAIYALSLLQSKASEMVFLQSFAVKECCE